MHGRYSKVLPQGLRQKYQTASADPELMSLREEIAAQTALLMAEMEKLAAAPEPSYADLLAAIQKVRDNEKDPVALQRSLLALEEIARAGGDAAASRRHSLETIRQLIQEKTKTVAAEWKRMMDLENVITADRAMNFVEALLTAAREVIGDEAKLVAYQSRVLALYNREKATGV